MARPHLGVVLVLACLVSATVGCSNDVQRGAPAGRPTPSHGPTSAASPSPTTSTGSPVAGLSVTRVWTYPAGVVVVSADTGAGADRRTHVFASANHGSSFADVTPAGMRRTEALSVDDVVALDRSHFWLAVWSSDTTQDTVYRTTDGGRSWRASIAPGHNAAAGSRDSLAFDDERDGWLVQQMPTGSVSALYRTSDGGRHWLLVNEHLPQVAPLAADPETGLWQGGGSFSDRLTHSSDGGRTWSRVDLGAQDPATTIARPAVFTGQVLAGTSTLTADGQLLRFYGTDNAGATWTLRGQLGLTPDERRVADYARRTQVAIATPSSWWAISVVPRPTVFRTADSGRTWTTYPLPGAAPGDKTLFVQIASSDPQHAWAILTRADVGLLLATTDGGSTWSPVDVSQRLVGPTRTTKVKRPRCDSTQLTARVAQEGSVASQPFATIALRNHSATTCRLRGYPGISAFGQVEGGPVVELAIRLRRGRVYERRDPGPHQVILEPGATSSFSIGTGTAYDPPLFTITRLLITPPGDTDPIPLAVQMYATHPPGRPIPIGVTAVQLGVPRR